MKMSYFFTGWTNHLSGSILSHCRTFGTSHDCSLRVRHCVLCRQGQWHCLQRIRLYALRGRGIWCRIKRALLQFRDDQFEGESISKDNRMGKAEIAAGSIIKVIKVDTKTLRLRVPRYKQVTEFASSASALRCKT